ncbi:MAG: RNA polymerase sigma factor [Bacteroidota bacterium]
MDDKVDKIVVERLMNVDHREFKYFVELYADMVFRVCNNFVNHRQNAEDLSQEVFIEVYNNIGQFKKESHIKTWIYRIAINKSLNFLRKKKQNQWLANFGFLASFNEGEDKFQHEYVETSTETNYIKEEQKAILYKTIEKLPKNQRIAFTLNKIDELSYKEISEIMNISVSSVESLIHRAKNSLQAKLLKLFL